jgi:regulatory protein
MPDNTVPESLNASTIDPAAVRLAAMDLLARREHTARELRDKLIRRFPDDEIIREQLARLAEERLQSDERFAASYAQQRSAKGYGPLRVREELRQRGVNEGDVVTTMQSLEIDWRELAADVMRKKFGTRAAVDLKEKSKRVRFMQYRGFTADHYQRLLPDS